MSAGDRPVLPHSLELEYAVLNPALEWGQRLPSDLSSDDFYRVPNQLICRAIQALQADDMTPEYPVVRHYLEMNGHLETVGQIYLSELARGGVKVSEGCTTANIVQLKALTHRRRVAELFRRCADHPGDVDLEQFDRDLTALRIAGGVGIKKSFRTAKELAAAAERVEWCIPGYLACGAITELTGKAKLAGKTTLVAFWVACLLDGTPCFNAPALAGPVIYLTEQTQATFREVLRRQNLLERDDLVVLSKWDVPGLSWPTIAAMAGREAKKIGAKVIVVDTLPQFAGIKGDGENNSGDALEALEPCQRLANDGLAILLVRHSRKSGGEVGEDGRGSTAFTAGVDIVLSLKRPEGHHPPSHRTLEGISRYTETPAKIVIDKRSERSVHHPDPRCEVWAERFEVLGSADAVAHDEAKEALRRHVPTSKTVALSINELMTITTINRSTLERALKADPTIQKIGKGNKKDPHRYFRPVIDGFQTSILGGEHEQHFESAVGEAL